MKSKHFKIFELVPEHIYKKYGERAWRFIDKGLIIDLDIIKDRFSKGTMTINNYFWGGDRNWSGYRTPESPDYSETSQHKGNAFDAVFSEYTAEEVRADIIANPEVYKHIRGLENNVLWLHADTRNEDALVLFNP